MANKKKKDEWLLPVAIFGAAILIYLAAQNGGLNINIGGNQGGWAPGGNDVPSPTNITNRGANYTLNMLVSPRTICRGDYITVSGTTNIPNAECVVFYSSGGIWTPIKDVNPNAGTFSTEIGAIVWTPGIYPLTTVCCDSTTVYPNRTCKQSNVLDINEQVCGATTPTPVPSPSPGLAYTCDQYCKDNGYWMGGCGDLSPILSPAKSNALSLEGKVSFYAPPPDHSYCNYGAGAYYGMYESGGNTWCPPMDICCCTPVDWGPPD